MTQPTIKQFINIVLIATCLVAVAAKPSQPNVTLEWTLSPDASVTGYKVYRVEKDTTLAYDAGLANRYTVPLIKNHTYGFFVTAYNNSKRESAPTETIVYTAPSR